MPVSYTHLPSNVAGAAHPLGHHHDEVALAHALGVADAVEQVLLGVKGLFGDQDDAGPAGDAGVQGDVPGPAAHHLDHAAALVGVGSVPQFVDHLHGGIHGGIIADGVLAAGDVVVDGAGDADAGDPYVGEVLRAAERAVAADDHQAVDAVLLAHLFALHDAGHLFELQAAGSVENGAAPLNDLGHRADAHVHDLLVEKTGIAAHDPLDLDAHGDGGADDCANGGVHARGIPAAGQDADRLDLFIGVHGANLLYVNYLFHIRIYCTRQPNRLQGQKWEIRK